MRSKWLARAAAGVVVALLASPVLAQETAAAAERPEFGRRLVDLAVALALALIALFLSLWLAMKAVEMAIKMFDKVTEGIDEWEELRKGNLAVGILMAAVIVAVGTIISSSVTGLTGALMAPSLDIAFVVKIVVAAINLLIGLWIATYVIGLAIRILDKMTKGIEEMKEIAKGNVAVAIMVAGVLIAVSVVVSQGVAGVSRIINVESLFDVVGVDVRPTMETTPPK
jgi:uncharacterized membrane protein YjfL (UPF0719 family)